MNESRATRYQRLRRRARVAGVGSAGVMIAAIALTPVARWLSDFSLAFADGLSGWPQVTVSLVVFVALVVVLWDLATVPAVLYLAMGVDRRYGRVAPSVEEVLGAQLQSTAVVFPAALVAGASVALAVRLADTWWWVVAGGLLGLALLGAIRVAPWVLVRLGDVRPLSRQPLADRLVRLSGQARVPVAAVGEWRVSETASTTALVTGVGRTRRILLSSAIVRDWPDDEIVVVVAHELAHHVHRDLARTIAFNTGVLCGALGLAELTLRWVGPGLGVSGAADLAALPFVALVASAVWTVATPLRHAQSRQQERRADTFALTVTGGVEAFRAAVQRLGRRFLVEERPTTLTRWLYHSHPSVAERLALADAYARVHHTR